jgi:RNA polymerase sigma-70 factor (ECF subfamily)
MPAPEGGARGPAPHPLETTALLLDRARAGDEEARNRLCARFIPVLTRWAHQRLPRQSRDLAETGDLVQVTLVRALGRLEEFESRGEGAFLGYLRQILLNAIRDEARRAAVRRGRSPLHEGLADPGPTALEEAVGRDALRRYESGLARLSESQREAILLKVEMGYTNAEIAQALGKPSADAVRMLLARALVDLAEHMDG